MDGDEIEVTREELHKLIRKSVNSRQLMSENMRRKCNHLQSLFEQKKKLSTDLLKLFESVSKCEATVRQLYAKLGWEYKDPEDDNCNNFGFNSEAAGYETDETDDSANYMMPAVSDEDPLEDTTESRSITPEEQPIVLDPRRELRVVLTRLPMEQRPRRSAAPSTSKRKISDDEVSNADSDYQPSGASSDSDFFPGSTKSDKQKKKKFIKTVKEVKTEVPVSLVTPAQSGSSVHPVKSEPFANTNSMNETKPYVKIEVKAETKPLAVSDKKPDENLPIVLQVLNVGMKVLARRKKVIWERGEISEILEKEDGTKKFKVTFEDKGKVLVSGHHVAFDAMPKLVHLAVGTRVVSKYSSKNTFFSPGILGELPSRKNHMRFLIFFDDQKTLYVALPVIRLVSMQLADPVEDIRDEVHKDFMKDYLSRMPYPPHTQFRVDQTVNVLRDGVLETATVMELDSALMLVAYANDDEREWIYRGSVRLEHIMNMKK